MADENILEMDLSEADEQLLRESLEGWKEEVYAKLLEEVEEVKDQKIEELEESNIEYREELKKEFADKMIDALKEMREEIRAEVLSEMLSSNPELQLLEKIKEIVAPAINEDYLGNLYVEEIQRLAEENEDLKQEKAFDEGAKTLAELIAPFNEQTQNIILAVIKEGTSEEVTEQFYEIIESLNIVEKEGDEEDEESEEDDDEEKDDKKKDKSKKPKKADFDSDEEYEKALEKYEKEKESEEEDDENFESYTDDTEDGREELEEDEKAQRSNALKDRMRSLIG